MRISHTKSTGVSPLIDSGEYNFSQVAYMTGFNDPKYFSRRFKKIMGVTPTEYKERKGDAS